MPTIDMIKQIVPATFQKAASPRTIRVAISTGGVDRDRDVIDPQGWRFTRYLNSNPIVLWQHDRSIPAIARTLSIRVVGQDVIAECEFPPEGIHELADLIYSLSTLGFLHSASVGFLPIQSAFNHQRDGHDVTEAELLEWSFVNIPSNYEATVQRCVGAGCDVRAMKSWLSGERAPACGCGQKSHTLKLADDAVLDILPDVLDIDEDVLDIVDADRLIEVSPEHLKRLIATNLAQVLTSTVITAVRDAQDYELGIVR